MKKVCWADLFKRNLYYEQKDVTQNIFSLRCFCLIVLFYTFAFILNVLGIFIVDTQIFLYGYVGALILVAVYLGALAVLGFEHPGTKYLNITFIALLVTIAGCTLTYHTIIIIIIPIIFASMYAERRLAYYALVLTILAIAVSTYVGYFYGVCDANMVLLTCTSLSQLSENGHFLLDQVNENPAVTLAMYYVFPRSLLAIAFFAAGSNIFHILKKTMGSAMRMKHLAEIDDMTGLYNKNKLLETLDGEIAMEKQIAVIYWDVNQLKKVNDTYGHIEGDILIAKVAESIKMVMDANASAYRYGGDEFIMLVPNGNDEIAEDIIRRWKKALKQISSDSKIPISASAGYACGRGNEIKKIIGMADKKMYANKEVHREK